jgi:hypothetical protein
MSVRKDDNTNIDSLLKDIVTKKLASNQQLSRDEHWYYLTKILRVREDEAEKMMSPRKREK